MVGNTIILLRSMAISLLGLNSDKGRVTYIMEYVVPRGIMKWHMEQLRDGFAN